MTVTLKLGEAIVSAAVDKLKAGMPARVDTINGENTDFVLNVPLDTSYFVGRVPVIPEPPAIFVMEGPSRFSEEGPHSIISHTDVLIYVLESAQTGPELATRLQRQVRAVVETIYDDDPKEQLTGSAYRIFPLRTVPGTVFHPETPADRWRAFYLVVFSATQEEC